MRLAPHIFALSLGPVLLACSSSTATTVAIARPQLVAVDPQDFLGTLQCADTQDRAPGLVRSYVATLYDVTPASDGSSLPEFGFPLPSSPPTSCFFPVTFSYVLVDHRYRALVEAYDRFADTGDTASGAADADADAAADGGDGGVDLTRIMPVSVGGRLQEDGTLAPVPPRWTATCGGYLPTVTEAGVPDAAAYITTADKQDAGDAAIPGVISYDAITQTVHNCGKGLVPVNN
jgi:hypothetical protein